MGLQRKPNSDHPTYYITDIINPYPYNVCCQFVSDDIIHSIVFQTNLYAKQSGTPTNEKEIRTYIGISFIMRINKLPTYKDAWSTVPYLQNEYICRLTTESFESLSDIFI